MKKLGYWVFIALAAFAILGPYLAGPLPAPRSVYAQQPNQIDPCSRLLLKTSTPLNITSTAAVLVAPASLSATGQTQTNYVCSFVADIAGSATSAGTLQFEYGTQATNPCDTGATTLTGAMGGNLTAGQPQLLGGDGNGMQFSAPKGKQICAIATGTTISIQGYVAYVATLN